MTITTRDQLLPTTVPGSWPRPRWFDRSLWRRRLSDAMVDVGKHRARRTRCQDTAGPRRGLDVANRHRPQKCQAHGGCLENLLAVLNKGFKAASPANWRTANVDSEERVTLQLRMAQV